MSADKISLGTAQFGLPHPFSMPQDRVPEAQIRAILDLAGTSRVRLVDTAPTYGDCERSLGRSWPFPSPFKVITKTLPLSEGGLDRVEARARRSVELLVLARAHAIVVSKVDDLLGPDGEHLWNRLKRLKDQGLFERIGVSCEATDAPALLARRYKPDIVQVPVSLLDQRLVRDGSLDRLAEQGVEVHARSVFSKGLLFLPRSALPSDLMDLGPRLSLIRRRMAEAGADPLHAALSYVQHMEAVSKVMVGVASAAELRAVLAAAERPKPKVDFSLLCLDEPRLLDGNPASNVA